MSKVKFKLNRSGVRELLRSAEAQSVVESYARSIQGRAGDGYEVSTYTGTNRVNASVYAATAEARRDNDDNNNLLKSRGGGK